MYDIQVNCRKFKPRHSENFVGINSAAILIYLTAASNSEVSLSHILATFIVLHDYAFRKSLNKSMLTTFSLTFGLLNTHEYSESHKYLTR